MRFAGALLAVCLALPPVAAAQSISQPFFVDEVAERGKPAETLIDGSLTSTTFFFQELAGAAPPLPGSVSTVGTRVSSPFARLFTDLRGQLSARRIKGSRFEVRVDARYRYVQQQTNPDGATVLNNPTRVIPTQSGTFGGDELELRELYVRRDGRQYDVYVGRKFQLELAAMKFDGVEVQKRSSKRWSLIGFAGLYPQRGSRNLADDYPKGLKDPNDPASGPKRIAPLIGGGGAAYRTAHSFGALGAVAILPLATDKQTGTLEKPRVFATSNGYLRASQKVDLFHYLVVDAAGAAGFGLTNLTLGTGLQPRQSVRLSAVLTQVDTETLNVHAQQRLEEPDVNAAGQLQNNIEVSRVSQQSARVGLSVALRQARFEVSTSATYRRRGALSLATTGDGARVEFGAANAIDVVLSFVDRRSWKGMRLGGSVLRTFGVGGASLDRTRSLLVRLDASRDLRDGKAAVEGNLSYVNVKDDNVGVSCNALMIETCFGAATVNSFGAGALFYYRFHPSWFALASGNVGRQNVTSAFAPMQQVKLPPATSISLFFRLAYRF